MASITQNTSVSRHGTPAPHGSAPVKTTVAAAHTNFSPDLFDDASSVRSNNSGPVVHVAPPTSHKARNWTLGTAAAAVGATILGFAGYGMYAAAPHIAAGVVAVVAIPAVHFVGIGVLATLAAVAVGFAAYYGVKKVRAWHAARAAGNDLEACKPTLTGSPRASEKSGLTDVPPLVEDHVAEALASLENSRRAKTPVPAIVVQEARSETPQPATRKKTHFSSLAAALAPALTVESIKKQAAANWDRLDANVNDPEGWREYYAPQVLEYNGLTTSAAKANLFSELRKPEGVLDVFPEVGDQKTFEAALPALVRLSEDWTHQKNKKIAGN